MTSPASKIGQIAGVLERGLVSVFIYLYWWPSNEPSAENITADCLERLRLEGNTYLLRKEELPPILQESYLKRREWSRMRRFIYQCTSGPEWRQFFIQRLECGRFDLLGLC